MSGNHPEAPPPEPPPDSAAFPAVGPVRLCARARRCRYVEPEPEPLGDDGPAAEFDDDPAAADDASDNEPDDLGDS